MGDGLMGATNAGGLNLGINNVVSTGLSSTGAPTNVNSEQQQLSLGQVNFQDMEVPQELALGGSQAVVTHDFPGGIRTVQTFGAFPPESISWEGKLFGSNAQSRSVEIDRMRVAGVSVDLTFGHWSYSCIVHKFTPVIKNIWLIDYKIALIPYIDKSAGTTVATPTPTAESLTLKTTNQISQTISAPPNGYTFPAAVLASQVSLNQVLNNSLQSSGGTIAGISPTNQNAIANAISAMQLTLQPAITGADPIAASASMTLNNQLNILSNVAAGPPKLLTTITVNSPNLFNLASQYYGDPSLWTVIAKANNLLDPIQMGTLTLQIPTAPGSSTTSTTTYLTKGQYN